MIRVLAGRAKARHDDENGEDRAILSFTLLLSLLVSGFVIALAQAAPNASLLNLITNF